MAKILPMRPIRLIGTTTGASPIVENYMSAGALKRGAVVYSASGKATEMAIIGAADTNDLLDSDTGATAYTAPVLGLTLNTTTAANQIVKVAVFGPVNIFEGNFAGSATSGTAANIVTGHAVLALSHIGNQVSFLLPKVDVNHVMNDGTTATNYQISSTADDRVYVLSSSTTGTTPLYGKIVRVNLFTPNDVSTLELTTVTGLTGIKGTIGDKQPRVHFIVTGAGSAGLLAFGAV